MHHEHAQKENAMRGGPSDNLSKRAHSCEQYLAPGVAFLYSSAAAAAAAICYMLLLLLLLLLFACLLWGVRESA